MNYVREAIDNQYNIAPPEILNESDFESPTIVYNPKKSVFDERLKDLREDFSLSLYADLKDRINASSNSDRAKAPKEQELDLMSGAYSFDESFSLAKKHCVKNFKEALKDFAENAMQDDLGQKIRDEVLEDMLKIAHDLENLEQDAQYQRRRIDEQIEEAKSLMKKIDRNFHSQSEIDKLVREAKEHEKEANRRYDEYLKSKDKE
ncbi:hypothetical protein [Helicobacter pylori]|uniref:hypothetical protein n=1 Tax=Helicobacter pylori TaxID=210 RepID=UPI0039E108AA